MNIWKRKLTLPEMNQLCAHCAVAHLGIEFSAQGSDWLEAIMPVDSRTTQPMGLLHGGVSVALAESVGSLAALLCTEESQAVVGTDINASHIRPVKSGIVTARATPIHLGKRTQVWQINIRDSQEKLCCTTRLTLSII